VQQCAKTRIKKTGLSVQAPSWHNNEAVATVVRQIMTEHNRDVSEEKMVITKMVQNLMKQNGS
jgi:hypothetical protein